jgi:Flp pilus assembly protein TadG
MDKEARSPQQRAKGLPRPSSPFRRLWSSERGTAVVEFALIAPILFLLVFGIIEFGRVLNAYNDLTQLAGQGARAAAVSRNPDGTAVGAPGGTVDDTDCGSAGAYSIQCQLANYYAKQDSLKGVNVCIPSVPTSVGAPVTVHVTYTYQFATGLFGLGSINLSSTQTERSEAPPPVTYAAGDQTGSACT